MEMPKATRDNAPPQPDAGPVVDLRDEFDGYTVSFTSLLEDIDATPLMKGLPDDRCQCPHWGYVFKGKMTARYADHDEVFEAGDAFYTPPGRVPVKNEPGTAPVVPFRAHATFASAGAEGDEALIRAIRNSH
jgi:hypothetical protein